MPKTDITEPTTTPANPDAKRPWTTPQLVVTDPALAGLTLSNISSDGILFS